jgi:cell division protein FtsW
MKMKHMLIFGTPVAVSLPAIIFLEPYRMKRLVAFLDPWANPKGEGFQLIQSLYALGSGGFFGVGLFASRQKFLFLPFAESDFIFSIIVEELGLIGGLIVLFTFALLIISLVKLAFSAKNKFGCLLVSGVASVICVQVLLNISVVSGLIPPTGLPLPFISAGSTSIVVFMAAVGVCLNVAKSSAKNFVNP